MDTADYAADYAEIFTEKALSKIKIKEIPYSGKCLNCGDSCGQQRYCDSDCRIEHENKIKRRR